MQIELSDDCDLQNRATAAGFTSVSHYVQMLIDRDVERAAILAGIESVRAGNVRPFEDFDREFRARHGLPDGD